MASGLAGERRRRRETCRLEGLVYCLEKTLEGPQSRQRGVEDGGSLINSTFRALHTSAARKTARSSPLPSLWAIVASRSQSSSNYSSVDAAEDVPVTPWRVDDDGGICFFCEHHRPKLDGGSAGGEDAGCSTR